MKRTQRHLLMLTATLSAALFGMNVQAANNTAGDTNDTNDTHEMGNMAGHMQKQVKPHSHMEEKLGMSVKKADDKTAAAETPTAKTNPMFDKSRHFHPRDGGK